MGRPKGSKNRINTGNREALDGLLKTALTNTMTEDIALLTPKERVDAMLKLASMLVPKQTISEVDMSVETSDHPFKGNIVSEDFINDFINYKSTRDEEE